MKRCPVCGVMMGDNVARCSMCKYDFQKASQGNNEEAAAEAKKILVQKEQENIARAEAKRSEEEKRILEALEKSVDTIRDEVIEARDKRDALRKEANEMIQFLYFHCADTADSRECGRENKSQSPDDICD